MARHGAHMQPHGESAMSMLHPTLMIAAAILTGLAIAHSILGERLC